MNTENKVIELKPEVITQILKDLYDAMKQDVSHLGCNSPEDTNVKLSYLYKIYCLMWKVRRPEQKEYVESKVALLRAFDETYCQLMDMCQALVSVSEVEDGIKTLANYKTASEMIAAAISFSNRVVASTSYKGEYYLITAHDSAHLPVYGTPDREFVDNALELWGMLMNTKWDGSQQSSTNN